MSRLAASILKRDQIVERMAAHPLTLSLGAVMVFAQAAIYVCEIASFPFSSMLALNWANLNPGAIMFPFTHYAPLSPDELGVPFSPFDFLVSVTLFLVCGMSLLSSGPVVEQYYGTRKTAAAFFVCMVGHAAVASALPDKFAFSTLAFATFLIVTSLLVQLERRETRVETQNDFRMAVLMAALVLAAMGAAFLGKSYVSLLAAVAVGPAFAVLGFVLNWKLQMRAVRLNGQGKVGNLYFVEEIDLLTRHEVEERMDRLLDKIAGGGMESLDPDEQRFLKSASRRLKHTESDQSR
ncbi:MAG: hypothetical protein KF696_14540 [Planctomycetes bacterium]|nr:hypothetical protein [Planctomycetota bacterium]MCW8137164.1 hypothetical protein [Planctomycetota bacterium]